MQTISLSLSVSNNVVVNPDGVTLLRSLSLVQGETYQVNLAFVGGDVPSIGDFAFYLRSFQGSNLISVSSVTSQAGEFPYYFILAVDSPVLTSAIGANAFLDLSAVISYTSGSDIQYFEPFRSRVFSTSAGASVPFVSTVNALSGDVTLSAGSNITLTPSGQNISISAAVITASGILKSDGLGDISAAIVGTDYMGGTASLPNFNSLLGFYGIPPVPDGTYTLSATLGGSITFQGGIVTSFTSAN